MTEAKSLTRPQWFLGVLGFLEVSKLSGNASRGRLSASDQVLTPMSTNTTLPSLQHLEFSPKICWINDPSVDHSVGSHYTAFPFYRWENWGPEQGNDLPKIIWEVTAWAWHPGYIPVQLTWAWVNLSDQLSQWAGPRGKVGTEIGKKMWKGRERVRKGEECGLPAE